LFKDVPLTSGVVESLVQELFFGEVVERHRIVNEVRREHSARGGRLGSTQSCIEHVKLALNSMCNKGLAQNPSRGYWRIGADSESDEGCLEALDSNEDKDIGTVLDRSRAFSNESIVEDLGSGSGAIYLYYLPTYKELALLRNERFWACKIGRTDRDPAGRIWTQLATALPERPIIALVYRTDFPLEWERILHSVLTVRGVRMQSSPGSEWFVTSPDVVLELLRSLDPAVA
jgi:Meiotically up-regulated gene 113